MLDAQIEAAVKSGKKKVKRRKKGDEEVSLSSSSRPTSGYAGLPSDIAS